jgi:GNAT superfamily N-acetyltransferase
MQDDIVFRDGSAAIDLDQLAELVALGGWPTRDRAILAQQVEGSRYVASAWHGDRMVAFARGISDGVTNGYVSTVVVHPDHRGRGLGRAIVARLIGEPGTIRWVLHADPELHPFYERLGFTHAPDILWRPRRG